MPFLIIFVYGVTTFLYNKTRARLERRNMELQRMLQADAARLEIHEQEMQRALEIQRSLLPREIPQLPGIAVATAWRPARAVGGDYFDVLRLDGNRLAVCIADVSGKGVPAALLMANVQASLRASVRDLDSPARVCGIVKRHAVRKHCRELVRDVFLQRSRRQYAHVSLLQCRPSLPYPCFGWRCADARSWRRGARRFSLVELQGFQRQSEIRRQAAPIYRWHHRSRGRAKPRVWGGQGRRIRQGARG